jgi:hypothetical protein
VLAKRLSRLELSGCDPSTLVGAVLLAPVQLATRKLRKGARLDLELAGALVAAAEAENLSLPLRLAWPDQSDLHEDEAAQRLATAAAGTGIELRPPRQSRLDLVAQWNGVLHVRTDGLLRINAIDSLELFTLFHGQAVEAGQLVASVKVAPHLIAASVVEEGARQARESWPLIEVRPYVPLAVAGMVTEPLSDLELARFDAGARTKVESLGSSFCGTMRVSNSSPELVERDVRRALETLVLARRIPLILVGGVSAGDPLSPFYAALNDLGGRVIRHGVSAHPGSMIWLAELGESRLLGLPQCGMFTMATAADLILPRLLTGERLGPAELAELAHGGILTGEMRFRFPAYARNLDAPEG